MQSRVNNFLIDNYGSTVQQKLFQFNADAL